MHKLQCGTLAYRTETKLRTMFKDYDKTQTNEFASLKRLQSISVPQFHSQTDNKTGWKLK